VAPVPGPATPPADGVGPSAGQVDLYLALTADRERATAQLLQLDTALTAAKAGVSGLTVERAAAQAAIRQDQAAADAAQHGADTVASTVYQQGDDGLGVIATAITSGSEGLLDRLATLRMVRSTASNAVADAVAARAELTLATARLAAIDLRLDLANATVTTAIARVTAAEAVVTRIDVQLRTLAVVAPQVAVGPDGCPTENVPETLRDGAEAIGAAALCRAAVLQAATPQAALAITWAFQHLGAAYACGGAGRLLPFRMDCSSFVSRAYYEGAGLATAGTGWAPSTRDMVPWDGVPLDPHDAYVAPDALRPGDLVLYDPCPQGTCPYKHVVMYLGSPDGGATRWMVHTNACGDVAKVEAFTGFPTSGETFLVARRVLALPGEKVAAPLAAVARAEAATARTLAAGSRP
jgi:cell wall-associated NlpC family hydrolase